MNSERIDRLYELLPVVYRQRDEELSHALRDLLRVIAEQVNLIERDIAQLYENWFIETCQDWVVPYIADLVGYDVPHSGGTELQSRLRTRALAPRRAVANYLRDLRRRGTLALLEELAEDTGGFSSRAVEYYTLLGRTQSINHLNERGRLVDLRDGEALDLIDGPFDSLAHTVDMRGINALRPDGLYNIPNVTSWIWRLRSFPITDSPAYFVQRGGGYFFYTFSALGNDAPIFTKAEREPDQTIAGEINVATPIRRRALEERVGDYYGPGKSFAIWIKKANEKEMKLVEPADILAADLTDWKYRPPDGKVVVDPKLGRIAVSQEPEDMVVSYHYGFGDDIGAHESARPISQPRNAKLYSVGENEAFDDIVSALKAWKIDVAKDVNDAVIEITDDRFYTELLDIEVPAHKTLQLRAANRCRPVVQVLDYRPSRGESLTVILNEHSRFTLDGILVAGRPLRVEGKGDKPVDARLVIRRSTLVPGWAIHPNCDPAAPGESSVDIRKIRGKVTIDRSILGSISVMDETAESEPVAIAITDSIVDATSDDREAVIGPGASYAWATLRFVRCTVFGTIETHAIELAENSIFTGIVRVVRRQTGCIRFCWVPPGSRTPKRYHCQPDLVDDAAKAAAKKKNVPADPLIVGERRRVEPVFSSVRFGRPDYAQLGFDCAVEIHEGADDESEMGAFHDLFLPQRVANLRARLTHSTPSGMETGIIWAD
jgi:hypothetical protein